MFAITIVIVENVILALMYITIVSMYNVACSDAHNILRACKVQDQNIRELSRDLTSPLLFRINVADFKTINE